MKHGFLVALAALWLAQVAAAKTVTFTIKPGTGIGDWNTKAEMLTLEVGDTLKLVNADSVEHSLHTGGTPCEHSDYLQPGQSQELKMTGTWNPERQKPLYDHFYQTTGHFWLKVVHLVPLVIKPGTHDQAWNTAESKLTLKVGDTLHIVNQDDVVHAIHTGGQPFPHTPAIQPGQTYDTELTAPWNLDKNGPLYDHYYQEEGFIYLEVLP